MLLTRVQILNITLDNTSNNDTMIAELELSLEDFSDINRTCCFMHIINIVAKSFLKQFDAEKKCGAGNANVDDIDLDELVKEVEIDKSQAVNDTSDEEDNDDLDGWVVELEELSDEKWKKLLECIKPIKCVLFKVSYGILVTCCLPELPKL